MKRKLKPIIAILFLCFLGISYFISQNQPIEQALSFALTDIPPFKDAPYVVINENQPTFPEEDFTATSFEQYSALDGLGRCGVAYTNIGIDLMPTASRESIGHIKPTGWKSVQYDFVDGKSLYNRCHLIGFQLAGENANEKNLITGTRYMNVSGMLPFENMIADYVKETRQHVLYRVTPIFEGSNLVASGVQMEAMSTRDAGEEICFNVYVYNNQPGVEIDYATGENFAAEGNASTESDDTKKESDKEGTYILNTNSKKFHLPSCSGASNMKETNKENYTGSRKDLIDEGYAPCGQCTP